MYDGPQAFLSGVYLIFIALLSLRPGQVRQEMRNVSDRYSIAEDDPLMPLVRQRIVLEARATVAAMLLGWAATVVVSSIRPGTLGPGLSLGCLVIMMALVRILLVSRLLHPLVVTGLRISRPRAVGLVDYVAPTLRGTVLVLSAVLLGVALWAGHEGLSGAVVSGAALVAAGGGLMDVLMAHLIRQPQPASDAHELFVQDALRARLVFSTYLFQAFFCAALCFILAVEAALITSAAALLVLVAPVLFGWLAWMVVGKAHLRFQERLWAGGPA